MKRRRLSPTAREALYDRCRGHEEHPRCNIPFCGLPVRPGERWVESHYPVPHAIGGTATGVAHARCNHQFWSEHEAPIIAKVKRNRRKHIGAHRAANPLPGGRDDPRKRTMTGEVVDRATGKPWGGKRGWVREVVRHKPAARSANASRNGG